MKIPGIVRMCVLVSTGTLLDTVHIYIERGIVMNKNNVIIINVAMYNCFRIP